MESANGVIAVWLHPNLGSGNWGLCDLLDLDGPALGRPSVNCSSAVNRSWSRRLGFLASCAGLQLGLRR